MRVLFLGDELNPLVRYLRDQGEDVEVTSQKINGVKQKNWLKGFDFAVSYGYRHIIRKSVIDLFPGRIINLHISLLPYNRGADPNLWSWIDGTPAGVTIHHLDPGLDTGDVLLLKEIDFFKESMGELTLANTYTRLQEEIMTLFCENWERLKRGEIEGVKQDDSKATFHYAKHKEAIMEMYIVPNGGWNIKISQLLELLPQIRQTLSSS
jgi:methionyl-tRNA formyltransferase